MLAVVIRILEALFLLETIGSAVVVVLTTIEDFKTLFKKDNEP